MKHRVYLDTKSGSTFRPYFHVRGNNSVWSSSVEEPDEYNKRKMTKENFKYINETYGLKLIVTFKDYYVLCI